MPATSKHQELAEDFFKDHDIGDTVTMSTLLEYADENQENGLASLQDIDDPRKRANTLKKYINDGGSSRGLPETERRILVTIDRQRGTNIVRQLSDHIVSVFPEAVTKSTKGAMIPLKKQEQAAMDINLEELPEHQRKAVETMQAVCQAVIKEQRAGTRAMLTTLSIQTLVHGAGMTEKQARYVLEHQMKALGQVEKLFRLTE